MIPVKQRTAKDCLTACLASVLEIPYEEVPIFEDKNWTTDLQTWLNSRGYEYNYVDEIRLPLKRPTIGVGPSPRNLGRDHAVVVDGWLDIVHDPVTVPGDMKQIDYLLEMRSLSSTNLHTRE